MKAWLENLQPRERLIVIAGAAAVLLVLAWALIWNPISSRTQELRQNVTEQREFLAWMQDASSRIKALEKQPGNTEIIRNVTLINAVESTSKRNGLRTTITNMKPDGDSKINLDIKGANFDDMILWQGELLKRYGIRADQFNAKASDQTGLVDARITLTR